MKREGTPPQTRSSNTNFELLNFRSKFLIFFHTKEKVKSEANAREDPAIYKEKKRNERKPAGEKPDFEVSVLLRRMVD